MNTDQIWKAGVPLCDAIWQFAPIGLRIIYRIAQSLALAFWTASCEIAPGHHPLESQYKLMDASLLGSIAPRAAEALFLFVSGIEARMRSRLLRALATGKLLGYGFEVPRKQNDFPSELPPDAFQPRFVNWQDCAIKGPRLEFAVVRVIRPSLFGQPARD